ncbi:hypothetical protein BDV95DRAFT_234674 [Massariosphaeria phaeospora]|uniref:Uncharacterized protein n=1 Tax=Massariosphaeria phaeospora TaxID=100035 RepID=A0A7C8MJ19_9PLEO|nr:hypothetical protein BDV95DRAFT_234674 [Massariosphaeria phaeospora]
MLPGGIIPSINDASAITSITLFGQHDNIYPLIVAFSEHNQSRCNTKRTYPLYDLILHAHSLTPQLQHPPSTHPITNTSPPLKMLRRSLIPYSTRPLPPTAHAATRVPLLNNVPIPIPHLAIPLPPSNRSKHYSSINPRTKSELRNANNNRISDNNDSIRLAIRKLHPATRQLSTKPHSEPDPSPKPPTPISESGSSTDRRIPPGWGFSLTFAHFIIEARLAGLCIFVLPELERAPQQKSPLRGWFWAHNDEDDGPKTLRALMEKLCVRKHEPSGTEAKQMENAEDSTGSRRADTVANAALRGWFWAYDEKEKTRGDSTSALNLRKRNDKRVEYTISVYQDGRVEHLETNYGAEPDQWRSEWTVARHGDWHYAATPVNMSSDS